MAIGKTKYIIFCRFLYYLTLKDDLTHLTKRKSQARAKREGSTEG